MSAALPGRTMSDQEIDRREPISPSVDIYFYAHGMLDALTLVARNFTIVA